MSILGEEETIKEREKTLEVGICANKIKGPLKSHMNFQTAPGKYV